MHQMKRNSKYSGNTQGHNLVRLGLAFSAILLLAGTASAQYGGTMGGTQAGTTGTPSYGSSGKSIGIGVGAAAGGAGLLYLGLRHRGSLGGCVSEANDKLSFTDDKTGTRYSLVSAGDDVKAGERFQLSGRKSTDGQGAATFEVKKVVKDLGACK